MSRSAFRASLDTPRERSAWLLVVLASATLWITQQLEPWAVALQVLALSFSFALREHPYAWQRSAWAINPLMFAIIAASISIDSRGGPATIAFAHFAALTQALQLLDTRPRQSEFLLVALALFQVVLASNLTDSIWFTPLLLAFVFSTVWTLMVHTLRMEAVEACSSGAITRAITPGLWRMSILATGASVLLAMLIFVALPRMKGSVVSGAPFGMQVSTSGFSERVKLGEIGRIRMDRRVVLRVETLEGRKPDFSNAYWGGVALDHFDGASWSVTPPGRNLVAGSAEGGVTLGHQPDQVNLVQRIVREPVSSGAIFGSGEVRRLQGTIRELLRDAGGGLYAASQADERVRYVIATYALGWKDAALQRDATRPPRKASRSDSRYVQLPTLSARVQELAEAITRGADSDAEKLRALETYLIQNGHYTDEPPLIDPESDLSPVEAFLFQGLAGHCEYFASAMLVLARSLSIPTRIVNGFAGGRENRVGNFHELRRSDAHSWVEAHYAKAGWVRYDPTPPDSRAIPATAFSMRERIEDLASAAELWWSQRIVGFDRADQIYALKRMWLRWHENRKQEPGQQIGAKPKESLSSSSESRSVALSALAALAAVAWIMLSRRRRSRSSDAPAWYTEALRLLARRGLLRKPVASARAFSHEVSAALPLAPAARFAALTECYLAERFGGRPAREAADLLDSLRSGPGGASAALGAYAAEDARTARSLARSVRRMYPRRPRQVAPYQERDPRRSLGSGDDAKRTFAS